MVKFFFRTENNPALLFIRLALGVVMFPHGAQKVFGVFGGGGYEKTMQVFAEQMHFLPILIVLLMATELVGSLCLIAGFCTRMFAAATGTALGICAWMNHVQHGFFMNWFGRQGGEGIEFHILAIGIALALVIKGGGALSVDRKIGGR